MRHLLLVSRRGPDAPRRRRLAAELTALGAEVTVAACDVADRDALAAVLARVAAEHPLTAVVHAAGVLDDGVVAVADARSGSTRCCGRRSTRALNLHELTARPRPGAVRAVLLGRRDARQRRARRNYAAANAFLDALAAAPPGRGACPPPRWPGACGRRPAG